MAEYNGSIELISGLIQKNNADFPLIEASAVAFYEDGKEIRLPEKIQSVGISQEERDSMYVSHSAVLQDLHILHLELFQAVSV